MNVYQVTPEEWAKLGKNAHLISFKEFRPPEYNRYTYVLVCADDDLIYAYTTVLEMDQDTAYMQHGGAMPSARGTVRSKKAYSQMVDWLKKKYLRISTRIENTNVPMLKFALSEGLLVDGCFCYEREVYLSLGWGF